MIEDKIKDVMRGMEGIGGVPTPPEYYAEFDLRVKAALGLVESDCMHDVSSNDGSKIANAIWDDLKKSKLVNTPNDGDCFRADVVVRAINKFTK